MRIHPFTTGVRNMYGLKYKLIAVVATLLLVAAACGSDDAASTADAGSTDDDAGSQSDTTDDDASDDAASDASDDAASDDAATDATDTTDSSSEAVSCETDGPVELEYWTWGGGYPDAAELWNSQNPDIQVNFSDIPVGNSGGYQKMFTAIAAGDGPDVAFIEFDSIQSFAITGALVDVVPLLGEGATADFLPSFTDQVALGGPGTMYNVPLGGGPMALFYRADLFEENDIAVPTTWDEFRSAAEQVRAVAPDAHIVNFDGGGNANWFAGMASQNGAQWFTLEGDSWSVTLDGPETLEVADVWQGLLDDDLAGDLPTFSPEWAAALANGEIWTWPSAVWGAGVIKGTAPDTAGGWAVAELPTWGPDTPAAASWGGGGLSVLETSDHQCEAAQFALWMGTDEGALKILNEAIGIYPTTNELLGNEIFGAPDPFFGDQKIFDVFLAASQDLAPFRWGPVMSDTYAAVTDGFSIVLSGGDVALGESLAEAEASTISALERQGFPVSQ